MLVQHFLASDAAGANHSFVLEDLKYFFSTLSHERTRAALAKACLARVLAIVMASSWYLMVADEKGCIRSPANEQQIALDRKEKHRLRS